jgi:membrane-associated phospholipid phosphatase
MKIISILAILLISKGGFGQVLSSNEFRLDKRYHNHIIIQKNPIDDTSDVRVSPYSLDLKRELAIFGTGAAMLTASVIIKSNMDPLTEEEVAALDPMDIPAFDRGTITSKKVVTAGDLLLLGSSFFPFTFLAHDETKRDIKILAVMTGEVFVFQLGLNFLVKTLTQRVRPYCYDEDTPLSEKATVSAKLSFYSGHTSTTAALAFFVAKVFSDYLTSTSTKFFIWTSAAIYPALTGMLRLGSGSHFRSDIIVGYITGALIGYLIPVLHKSKLKDHLAIHSTFSYNSVTLGVRCSF